MNDSERLGQAIDDADTNLPAGFRLRIEVGGAFVPKVELIAGGLSTTSEEVLDGVDMASLITDAVDLAIFLEAQDNGTD